MGGGERGWTEEGGWGGRKREGGERDGRGRESRDGE